MRSQLNRAGRPKQGALTSYDDKRDQQEEEKLHPGKDSASEKPWTLFTRTIPTSFSSL